MPPPGRRRARVEIAAAAAVVAIIAVLILVVVNVNGAKPKPSSHAANGPVDGIPCQSSEQLAYHIHQYLRIYDNGKRVLVPPFIGIPGGDAATCIYWLHTHDLQSYPSGVIHVESPTQRIYTLGQFLDIWKHTQPDNRWIIGVLASAAKRHRPSITVYLNGHRWPHSYRSIPLHDHDVIYIELGRPLIAPKPFNFAKYQL